MSLSLSKGDGGCCGRAVHRKLMGLLKKIKQKEEIGKDEIKVHLASCVAFDSHHGGPCPHKDYLKELIVKKVGLECIEGSRFSDLTEQRRAEGIYQQRTCQQTEG
ncbi:MAG: CGGC domain-containing protein [Planctomycetota bacterium]